MKQQQVYNLKEFAAKYQLKDIFGAYAAHIHTDVLNGSVLRDMASERTLFYKILLVKSGSVKFEVVLGTESAEDEKHQLTTSDLLVVSPKHVYKFTEISEEDFFIRRLKQDLHRLLKINELQIFNLWKSV